jgi:hypothetical protein
VRGCSIIKHFTDNDGLPRSRGPDRFSREPAYGCFQAIAGGGLGFDFLLGVYHATWEKGDLGALPELKAKARVIDVRGKSILPGRKGVTQPDAKIGGRCESGFRRSPTIQTAGAISTPPTRRRPLLGEGIHGRGRGYMGGRELPTNDASRRHIALIESKSGRVIGTCEVVDVVGPLNLAELQRNASRSGFRPSQLPYRTTYAWVVRDARRLPEPIAHRHPSGAVIWVKLETDVLRRLRRFIADVMSDPSCATHDGQRPHPCLVPHDEVGGLIDAHRPAALGTRSALGPELDPMVLAPRTRVGLRRPVRRRIPRLLRNEYIDQFGAFVTVDGPLHAAHAYLLASANHRGVGAGITFVRLQGSHDLSPIRWSASVSVCAPYWQRRLDRSQEGAQNSPSGDARRASNPRTHVARGDSAESVPRCARTHSGACKRLALAMTRGSLR